MGGQEGLQANIVPEKSKFCLMAEEDNDFVSE